MTVEQPLGKVIAELRDLCLINDAERSITGSEDRSVLMRIGRVVAANPHILNAAERCERAEEEIDRLRAVLVEAYDCLSGKLRTQEGKACE